MQNHHAQVTFANQPAITVTGDLAEALTYLNALIEKGGEYPDAIFKATQRFTKIDHDDLQLAYDDQFDH